MTNKERYKRTFSTLHASGKRLVTEETSMRKNKKSTFVRLAPAFAALVLAVVISTGAYASDAGHMMQDIFRENYRSGSAETRQMRSWRPGTAITHLLMRMKQGKRMKSREAAWPLKRTAGSALLRRRN